MEATLSPPTVPPVRRDLPRSRNVSAPDVDANGVAQDAHSLACIMSRRSQCRGGAITGMRPDDDRKVIIPMTCKKWSCAECGPRKVAVWRRAIVASKPDKFLTLTGKLLPDEDYDDGVRRLRRAQTTLVQRIRRVFGRFEYLSVHEPTKIGNPHLHLLVRAPYIPQPWLSAEWEKLTGCFRVDIRKCPQGSHMPFYVTKYILKNAREFASRFPGLRFITSSKGFLLEIPEDSDHPNLEGYTWTVNKKDAWDVVGDLASEGFHLVAAESSAQFVVMDRDLPALTSYPPGVSHTPRLAPEFLRQLTLWAMDREPVALAGSRCAPTRPADGGSTAPIPAPRPSGTAPPRASASL